MHPHEKPGYVDACHAARVCPSVMNYSNTGLVYCAEEHRPWERDKVHSGFSDVLRVPVRWTDGNCAPLEQGDS